VDRRKFLKILPQLAGVTAVGTWMRPGSPSSDRPAILRPRTPERISYHVPEPGRDEGTIAAPDTPPIPSAERAVIKARDYDRAYDDDILIEDERWNLLVRTAARLDHAQEIIGHGNFSPLGFKELIAYGHNHSEIGDFENDEIELLEELFHANAKRYGFLGEKVLDSLDDELPMKHLERIEGTAHWLLAGESLAKYERIRNDLGDLILLTSGVRGLAKQYQLFLTKAVATRGNLSQAARSLAPPGYSFHAVGDFDIGKIGLGSDNFTDRFAQTDEFKKLIDLGYVGIRYPEANPFGVRHEPWHIKIL
jgi:hypothetical protein